MTPERWQRVKALLDSALQHPAEQRAAFLSAACAGDATLRKEVESLVASGDRAQDFLEASMPASYGSPARHPPERVGPYRLLSEIAHGGMGAVYLAERTDDYRKRVAVKLLRSEIGSESVVRRFRQERQILAGLDHPAIARLLDGGTTEDGVPYFVMEHVEGMPVDEYCDSRGLSVRERLGLFQTVCSAVSYAHGKQVVHRDLKPGNILVTADGTPKLLDFGIAKLLASGLAETDATTTGLRLMTPAYASPEQVRGDPITVATDVYALGVLLYWLLTGHSPYQVNAEMSHQLARAICEQEPQAPSTCLGRRDGRRLARDLDAITLKALRKEPHRRYASVDEVSDDIRRHLEGRPVTARRGALTYRAGKFVRRKAAAIGAGSAIAVLAVAVGLLILRQTERHPDLATPGRIGSLAVLPLDNLSGDPEQEYLADGLTEALITDLSKIGSLRVISRTSIMRYKGAHKPLPEIARELGVQVVLEGSVQRSTDRVRINVQLIDAPADRHLWSERYERAFRDVLSLQSEIAAAVSREVRVTLTSDERARLARARPIDPWAHELYLKGRFLWNRQTPEALQMALKHYQEAVRADPAYAAAYAGIADTYGTLGTTPQGALAAREAMANAREAALKALALDDELAEAHATLAWVRYRHDWDWEDAEREFRRAIQLDPGNSRGHQRYSNFLATMGRQEESLAEAERGIEVDPLSPLIQWNKVVALFAARRFDEAMAQAQRVLELDPSYMEAHRLIGEVHAYRGRVREAAEALERGGIASRPFVLACLGVAHAHAGQRKEARRVLERLRTASASRYVPPIAFVIVHAALGENEAAFEWLDRAYAERSDFMVWLKVHAAFDPLHADPRFGALLRRVGFPADPAP